MMKPPRHIQQTAPSWAAVRDQLRATGPILLAALALLVASFVVVATLHFQDRVLAYQLIDDPAPFMGLPSYTGLLSHAGILVWCAATTVCGFGGALLWGGCGTRDLSRFLLILAGANAWLALDDLLVLHEEWAVKWLGFESRHTGEAIFFLAYGAFMAACFWRFRATIVRTDYLLLVVAIVVFGVSTALDVVLQLDMGGNNIFLEAVLSRSWGGPVVDIAEELLKLTGIVLWLAYLTRVAFLAARDAMRPVPIGAVDHQANRPRGAAAGVEAEPGTSRRRKRRR